jgi:hypothetical protein
MATYTEALIPVEEIVTRYLLKFKRSSEDYILYLEHLCNAIRDFNLYDGQFVVTQKVTLDATKKWIDLPRDFVSFIDLVTPMRGQWWSFTEKDRIVNTTTFTGLVEGRDEAQGEGKIIDQSRVTGYGAKGGWNKFKYTLDMNARRIYCDDAITDYIVLMYVSSGIKATEETMIPEMLTPMLDAYLLWKESYWMKELVRERDSLERDFQKERSKIRHLINSMSINQWQDILYSTATQSPQR